MGYFRLAAHNTESGSLDIRGIMQALKDAGFRGPMRPNHLYDRALGAMYLAGLWEGLK